MNPELMAILDRDFSGTLADFRRKAAKELNGTAWQALRAAGQPRRLLAVCMTGEYEIAKLRSLPTTAHQPVDWDNTYLIEPVLLGLMTGALIYQEERSPENRLISVLFISAEPRSISHLEQWFNLPP